MLLLHVMHLLVRFLHHFLVALNLVGLLLLIPILTVDWVSIVVIFKHHVFLILHLVGIHILHEARSVLVLVVKLLAAVVGVLAWLLVVLHRLRLLHLLVVKHLLLRRLRLLLILQKRSVAIATHSCILVHSRILTVNPVHWLLIHRWCTCFELVSWLLLRAHRSWLVLRLLNWLHHVAITLTAKLVLLLLSLGHESLLFSEHFQMILVGLLFLKALRGKLLVNLGLVFTYGGKLLVLIRLELL
jgi:hypothetical protein